MSAVVGALRAVLGLDSAAFDNGLKRSGKNVSAFQKRLQGISAQMRGIGAGFAVAGAGIAAALKGQVNAADDLSKAAQKFGIPIEALSKLKYAAELSDVSLETLGTATRKLSQNMVQAAKEGSAMDTLFDDIGVSATNADGSLRSSEEVMADIAGVMAAMPDGAQKTALAMQLFGKSGAEMVPMLNAGKDGLQEMMAEAEAFGLVISQETGTAAEGFNDNLTRLGAVMRGVAIDVMATLAPAMERLSDIAVNIAKWFRDLSPAMKEFLAGAAVVVAGLGPLLLGLGSVVWAISLIGGAFKYVAGAMMANPIGLTIAAIAAAGALIYYNWDGLAAWFSEMWVSIGAAFTAGWTAVKDAHVLAYNALVETWNAVPEYFTGLMGQIGAAFDAAWVEIKAKFFAWVEDFKQIGRDLMAGFTAGITAGEPAAETAIYDAMGNVTGHAESALDIQSPSKVFKGIGQHIMEGLGLGIQDNVPLATDAMGEVGDALEGSGDSLASRLNDFKSQFKDTFKGLVTGAMTLKEALGQILNTVANSFLDSAIGSITDSIFGALTGGEAFAKGGAFSAGRPLAFAMGGVVEGATAFAMQGQRMGVMGEAGPEAIMPLKRGANGKLGVSAEAGGGGAVQVMVRMGADGNLQAFVENVSGNVSARVVKEYDQKVLPQSVRALNKDPRKVN